MPIKYPDIVHRSNALIASMRTSVASPTSLARINRSVARLVDVLPNGPKHYATVQVFLAGGVPEVMLHLRDAGLLKLDARTVTGRTLGENLAWWENSERRRRLREKLQVLDRIDPDGKVDHHDDVSVELGASGNPPGFDQNLVGLSSGDEKTFVVHFPADYAVKEMADTDVTYTVKVKDIRRKVLPELDDEFAKDVGDFESLTALRDRVRADMTADAVAHAKQHVRTDLLKQLSGRITFELPASIVDREIDSAPYGGHVGGDVAISDQRRSRKLQA